MIQIADVLSTPLEYARLSREEMAERIRRRKQELNAVILGHNYQRVEIQEVSDYLGDSLGLSQEAASTDADVIVFCGVHFMAETAGLRVGVLPGGCSGFQYGLNIEDEAGEDDMILESQGIRLFVDPFSLQYLQGTEIDYVSTFQGSGFTFNNPNAAGGCGCGSSFTV